MKKFLVPLMALMLLFSACSSSTMDSLGKDAADQIANISDADNEYVLMVKGGYRTDNPDLTYETAFENFFGSPTWKYIEGEDGEKVVEFTGDCEYLEVSVKARLQFLVDEEAGTFEAGYLAFNEVPQIELVKLNLLSTIFNPDSEEESADTEEAEASADITSLETVEVDYNVLYEDYEANQINADKNYLNKALKLTGPIENIDRDFVTDEPYVTFAVGGEYSFNNVQFNFSTNDEDELAVLEKGQTVTIVGICTGMELTNVYLKDCYITDYGDSTDTTANFGNSVEWGDIYLDDIPLNDIFAMSDEDITDTFGEPEIYDMFEGGYYYSYSNMVIFVNILNSVIFRH